MKKAKKILSLAISLLMIASMFVIGPMSASAQESRLDNWSGNITTTLQINTRGNEKSDVDPDGNYLTLTETELYVGDSIDSNAQWLNYEFNYINEAGEAVSGTPTDMQNWYCNGVYMFNSQLIFGKFNGSTNNDPKVLDKAGKWELKTGLTTGDTITLLTFDVNTVPRSIEWNGFLTTTLNIKGGGDPTRSDVQDDGYYLTISDTDLYVGDSIVTNNQWLNYALNYTNDAGEAASGTVADNANWYCGDTWMFASQLQNGKINGWTDNTAKKFTKAGTWKCTVKLSTGVTVTLIEFEVKALPRTMGDNIFSGNLTTTLQINTRGANRSNADENGNYVTLTETDIYVGDSVVTNNQWFDYAINYTNASGTAVSSKIKDMQSWYCNGSYMFNSQLYYGRINGSSNNNAKVFDKAGKWELRTTTQAGDTVTLLTFNVNNVSRLTYNYEGTMSYAGAVNVKVYQGEGVPFSVEELFVGDKLVNGSDWWTNTNVPFQMDGQSYTGRITWLTIIAPSGNVASGYHVWNGGAIDYVLKEAGTYTLQAKVEGIKDSTGASLGSKEPVFLRTFTVNECPHNYEFTETVAATCTTDGYDNTTCKYCGDVVRTNIVEASGTHKYTATDGVITCENCSYSKTFSGNTELTYTINDTTGATNYVNLDEVAFVGDTLKNGSGWWQDKSFTVNGENGKVYNMWIVYGDMDYFNAYREKKLADLSYNDDNVDWVQVGTGKSNGDTDNLYTLEAAGKYTLVCALEQEGSSWLTNVIPFEVASIEVFDKPVVIGDLDDDNQVSASDLVIMQQHILGVSALDSIDKLDLNADNKINAVDITILQLKILGY